MQCDVHLLDAVRASVSARRGAELREQLDNAFIVVTDTSSLDEDRAEVEALSTLEGVLAAHVVFSNIEDLP